MARKATEKQLQALKEHQKPFDKSEEGREHAKKAQPKSVKQRKENRTFKEIYMEELSRGTRKKDIINAMLNAAETGNVAAYDRVIRDCGENPDATKETQQTINLVIPSGTADVMKNID